MVDDVDFILGLPPEVVRGDLRSALAEFFGNYKARLSIDLSLVRG
jgi:hypothetical protein